MTNALGAEEREQMVEAAWAVLSDPATPGMNIKLTREQAASAQCRPQSSDAAPPPAPWGQSCCVLLGFDDRAEDRFDDDRRVAVPEGVNSVHPIGNPMNHSTQFGFRLPRMAFSPCD